MNKLYMCIYYVHIGCIHTESRMIFKRIISKNSLTHGQEVINDSKGILLFLSVM